MKTIPIPVKRKCVELAKQGLTAREIYNNYYSTIQDTSYDSFRTLLKRWKKKTFADDGLLENANLGYKFIPHDSTVQVNGSGEIIQAWIKQKADSDNVYEQILDGIKNIKPFEPIERTSTERKERMLEIKLDDLHFGVAYFEDYEKTLQNIIETIESKQFEEINIIIGEDLLHTNDFRGHTNK